MVARRTAMSHSPSARRKSILKFFDFNDPFFKPLWIRIAVVVAPALWAGVELMTGQTFWGVLFLAISALAFHGLFIAFNPREPETAPDKEAD